MKFPCSQISGFTGLTNKLTCLVWSLPTISHTLNILNGVLCFLLLTVFVLFRRMAMFWWCQACTLPVSTGWRSRPSQQRVKVLQPGEPSRLLDTKAAWNTVNTDSPTSLCLQTTTQVPAKTTRVWRVYQSSPGHSWFIMTSSHPCEYK